ncbi:MAG: right-handed parallel beta-helix repeat-containing protein [Bacteroidales bacterium]|nr:right-handed parallel beta-helix repeat-containing protein [Bacteroidales bacterium]
MRKAIIGLLFAMSTTMALSTTYYTAPMGKAKNTGTSVNHPLDINTAFERLSNGDTLYCVGGQYNLNKTLVLNVAGEADKMVCIFPFNEERPILDFRNEPYGTRGIMVSPTSRFIHMKGLTIRYAGKNALLNYGSQCIFEGLDVYGNCDTGIQMKGAGGRNLILNCDSHDNFDYEHGGTSAADFGGNADGYADKQYTGPGNTYRGCRAWNNSDDGWDFYQRVSSGGIPTVLENCICMFTGPSEYDVSKHPRRERDKDWMQQFEKGLDIIDDDGKNAYVTLEHYPNFGNGNGFKMGGARTSHDIRLFQCLAVGNTVKGFDQNNDFGVMEIYNCTAYDNGINFGFTNGSGGTLILKNCLSYESNRDNVLKTPKVIESHNSWNLNVEVSDRDFESLDTSQLFLPRQADYSLAPSTFATLVEGSDLLDKGVFVNLPYHGVAPDLGYQERGVADQLVATVHNQDIIDLNADETKLHDVTSPNAKWTIGFVTLPNYDYDRRVVDGVAASGDFNVKILDATNASNDYSKFDMLVISPVAGSTAIAISSLKGYNKPMLLLKPFELKQSVWNWGTPANSRDQSISVLVPEHPVFRHLNIKRNQLQIYSKVVGEGAVSYVKAWNNVPGVVSLATPSTIANGTSLAEIPVGTSANGTIIHQRFLMLGLSEHSLEFLTVAGQRLLLNCCYYLVGEEIK